jgi:NADP-dependent 3-hydroxy acid dehydrogenase YdfG
MRDQRVVLITGASSSVGQATARLLSQRDYQVFGTSRHPATADLVPAVEMLRMCAAMTRCGRALKPFSVEADASMY